MSLFIYILGNGKTIVGAQVKDFNGEGEGTIVCPICKAEIQGKNYSWLCSKCGKEYLGPLLEK